jgi:hypothetical protein
MCDVGFCYGRMEIETYIRIDAKAVDKIFANQS